MKICPKCQKSNPDDSKKCFFCGEDLSQTEIFIPEKAEIKDPEEDEEFEEDFEEEEPKEKPEKIKIPLSKLLKGEKRDDFSLFYALKFIPATSIAVLVLGVFVSVGLFMAKLMAGHTPEAVLMSVSVLALTVFLSVFILFLGGILETCRKIAGFEEKKEKKVKEN